MAEIQFVVDNIQGRIIQPFHAIRLKLMSATHFFYFQTPTEQSSFKKMDSTADIDIECQQVSILEAFPKILLKKTKKEAGGHIKFLCDRVKELDDSGSNEDQSELEERRHEIDEIMNHFLSPMKNSVIDLMDIEWFRWLIASGENVDEFARSGTDANLQLLLIV